MNFLRAAFEESLEGLREPNGDLTIGVLRLKPSEWLRQTDETALEESYNVWLSDWIEGRLKRQADLLAIEDNKARLKRIRQCAADDRLVPFVGSGMSAPSGLPTWSALLRQLARQATCGVEAIDPLIDAGRLDEAATQLQSYMPEGLFTEQVENRLNLDEDDVVQGPVRLLPALMGKRVVSTNLDEVLERAYASEARKFAQVCSGRALVDEPDESNGPLLVKLHGHLHIPATRVIGGAEYDDFYAAAAPHRSALEGIFTRDSLLFLGCSLAGDRTLQVLSELRAAARPMPPHYALLELPEDEGVRRDREHFLVDRGIFPVWYDGGHDDCIGAVLVGLLREVGKL